MSVNVGGVLSATVGPQTQVYTAPDPVAGFGSITIYNNSNSPVAVYFGRTGLIGGAPDITVPAQATLSYPCPGAPYITVSLLTFPAIGTVQVSCTDTVLNGGASLIPGAVGSSAVPPAAAGTGLAGQIGAMEFNAQFINAYSSNSGSLVAVAQIANLVPALPTYVYSVMVSGIVLETTAAGNNLAVLCLCDRFGDNAWIMCVDAMTLINGSANQGAFNAKFSISGGPLPLFRIQPNGGVYFQMTSAGGVLGDVTFTGAVNVSYAQF